MSRKILVVADRKCRKTLQKAQQASIQHTILEAASPSDAGELMRKARPDLVIVEQELPVGTGLDWIAQWRKDPMLEGYPVLLICRDMTTQTRIRALRCGATDVLSHAMPEEVFHARLRNLLMLSEGWYHIAHIADDCQGFLFAEPESAYQPRITCTLIVPDPEIGQAWRSEVARHSSMQFIIRTPEEALHMRQPQSDICIVWDDAWPEGNVQTLLTGLRARQGEATGKFCVMLSDPTPTRIAAAWDAGVSEILSPEVAPEEIGLRLGSIARRKRLEEKTRRNLATGLRLAVTDALTGLPNRRVALPALAQAVSQARGTGKRCAAMVLDLDHFKLINDRYGHPAGDAVLIEVAQRLRRATGPSETLARIGGEEF